MRHKLFISIVICLFLSFPAAVRADQHFSAEVAAFDPPSKVELAAYDKLYLKLEYDSEAKVRFKVIPLQNGIELEYGAMTSSTMIWPAGKKDALAWVSFSTTTHIDEVRIVVLDAEWNKVHEFGTGVDTVWTSEIVDTPREPAGWVAKLIRTNRLRQELAFDPNPRRSETIYDVFFLLSIASIPFYLYLQFHALRNWRGRWRDLAAVPLVSLLPLVLAALFGMGMELRLWIIFIFRGTPLVLIYLFVLWFVRRMSLGNQADNPDS